jgi:arylsulfatase A-like enzyme
VQTPAQRAETSTGPHALHKRLVRPRTQEPAAGAQTEALARLGPGAVLIVAAWFGLLGGFLELVALVIKCTYIDPRYYNVSRHFPWMYPLAGMMVLAVPAFLLAAAARAWPRKLPLRGAVGVFSFLVFLGLLCRWPIFTVACLLLAAGLAAQTARLAARHPRGFMACVRSGLVFLAGSVAILAAACFGLQAVREHLAMARLPAPAPGARNVVLIVLDTVAAEHLSLYGYERDTSPNLARLAARGACFDLAISPAPWTTPAHASMFTGQWCHSLSADWKRPLDAKYPTLAEFLGARGYATSGFVANTYYCSYETGLDRGFAHYEDYDVTPRSILLCSGLVQRFLGSARARLGLFGLAEDVRRSGSGRKSAARLNGDFLHWLDRQPRRPFFAFLNYYDAHHPYLLPEPEETWLGEGPQSRADYVLLRTWWEADKRALKPRQVGLARDAYDSCIASLDRQLGRLFQELERRGELERTCVIVTADHGEHLGERELFGHGCSLYRPEVHVPLLVVAPGLVGEGRHVASPVSLRDLPATVCDLLGIPGKTPFPGASLARYWDASRRTSGAPADDASAEQVLSELAAPPEADPNPGRSPARQGPMRSAWSEGMHYIRNGDGREELYDVDRDPAETHDLAHDPAAGARLELLRRCAGPKIEVERRTSAIATTP